MTPQFHTGLCIGVWTAIAAYYAGRAYAAWELRRRKRKAMAELIEWLQQGERKGRIMKMGKRERGYTLAEVMIVLGMLFNVAISVAVIWAAIHFVAKFW